MSKILKNCPFIGTFAASGRPYYLTKKELRNNPHIGLIDHKVMNNYYKCASEYFYTPPTENSICGDIILPINATTFVNIGKTMLSYPLIILPNAIYFRQNIFYHFSHLDL